jgi:hypothetical protein
MEFFGDYFELLYFVGCSAVYRCKAKIPNKLLYEDFFDLSPDAQLAYWLCPESFALSSAVA